MSGRRSFRADRSGATAIEFAMILPLLCLLAFGSIGLGVALWTWNVLEVVSAETARCVAIESTACAVAPDGCAGSDGACFAMQLSLERGLSGMAANRITIDGAAILDGISYTSVQIAYPYSLLGYEIMLVSTNRFPNPS